MLWYCHFTWHPTTTREKIAQRIVQQHDAGENHPENIRGWYNLVGGGAGFLMIETEDFQDVTLPSGSASPSETPSESPSESPSPSESASSGG